MAASPMPPAPPQAAAPPPAPRSGRRRRVLIATIAVLALLVGTGAALTAWLWQSSQGIAVVLSVVDRLLPARLTVRNPSGSLADGFACDELIYDDGTVTVRIERLRASLSNVEFGLSLNALRFDFDELLAERLQVHVRPSRTSSTGPPASIASPVTVTARRLGVGAFAYRAGAEAGPPQVQLQAIDTQAAIGPTGYQVTNGRFAFGSAPSPLQVEASGSLGGSPPFAVQVRGMLTGSLRERPLQAAVRASGSLVDLTVAADVQADPARAARDRAPPAADEPRGRLQLRIASFDAPALRALTADFEDIDPAAWIAGAPRAQLTFHAELQPQPGPRFTLAGPVELGNRTPGAIDKQSIPLRAARAQIEATAQGLRVSNIEAQLARGAARGSFEIGFAQPDAWRAQASLSGVDPSALHSRLRPLAIDGEATVVNQGGDLALTGTLRNRGRLPLQATLDLRASRARVLLNTAQLTLGRGQAVLSGEVQLTGSRALRMAGSVVELDPALLVSGFEARITGTFNANGVLDPQPAGVASFALADSQVFGRPLAGRGVLTLAADQTLDVEALLSVRTATLTARGGLGAAGRSLALELVAPQLQELGLPVAGRLAATARLSGQWSAPAFDAQVHAAKLAWGDHRVDEVQAVATYSGGVDGTLAFLGSGANHRFRRNQALSLQAVTLRADGKLSDHQIELRANNEAAQTFNLALAGGWSDAIGRAQSEWQGELRTATASKPLDLQLLAPVSIRTDFARWAVGPIDLRLATGRVEQARFDLQDGVFSTSGRFVDLRPSELRGGDVLSAPLARGTQPHVPTTLRGNWNLRLGTQADGSLLIERSGGDILAGTVPMGIADLRVAAQVRANRLQAQARLIGTVAGRAEATLAAEVEHSDDGWRLAQSRPLAATVEVDMPSLGWINSLLSEAVRANMRVSGAARGTLRIDGTPAAPLAQGTFSGTGLRVAWIEQGIRLDNGTLAARIDGNTIFLDQLRFSGPPQVAPADRRAAQALAKEKSAEAGFLAMTGELQLRDLSGVLQVQAVRVPFLQRPDRWVIATGGANIVFDQNRVQLNGALAANAGFIDFTRTNLPSLSGDVQVARASDPVNAAREAPIGLNFDLGIDLGEGFYLRGAGLDTRVEGQVRLRAEGRGAIRATGTVEARDGTYEGFGQRLAIERGRVNFQGPLDNPGLDVLALRRGLPVEVGVSVTRTAANPLIKLYSSESMTEQQMLSWLVLGRAVQDTDGGQDRVALATAAASLLAGGGEGVGSQFARRLGIDEFSLRTGEMSSAGSLLPRSSVAGNVRGSSSTASEEIVTIGKRLSDNVTISFEQTASGAGSLVQVTYRLTKQLSVLARAGTENALNLVYTFSFD